MCATCGCSHGETRIQGLPHLDFGELRIVQVERDILSKNNSFAEKNRAGFQQHGILALNMVSSPGSGKTALLVRTISDLKGALPIAVIEGDQETANDAERIRATGAPAVQINTGRGCHLDAQAVERAVAELKPANGGLLFIENVGNLVCPSAFDLGEAARVVVFSVTEGEDKPVKYPDMFASADLILINKIDLLPYLQYDMTKAMDYVRKVNRTADVIQVSATGGQGLDGWYDWLRARLARSGLELATTKG